MSTGERIAHLVARRPRTVWGILALLLAVAGGYIATHARLDSDVLDMLPGHFESVGVYKLADREFSSARELIVGLVARSEETDMDDFTEHFAAALRKEPWVVRVMERSPIEAPGGVEELRAVALPLILNQSEEGIARLIAALQPDAITARLGKLRAKIEAGIGVSQAELEHDPLGIVFPALKGLRTPQFAAVSDPGFRTVLIRCDQPDLNEPACKATMERFDSFKKRVLETWNGGAAPEILCTGRSAYVAEMASKLKGDITSTLASSLALVALTFYAGFRRWGPLRAILDALILCCVLAVACGSLLFGALNMITVGLCSILIGLAVDFAMILYALYSDEISRGRSHQDAIAAALRSHGHGIWYGAITTAAAFLCLLGSGSRGYQQLGVLVACGILIGAAVMMTFFWLFLGLKLPAWLRRIVLALAAIAGCVAAWFAATTFRDWPMSVWQNIGIGLGLALAAMAIAHVLCKWIPRLPALATARPWRLLVPSGIALAALTTFALTPAGRVTLDLNPKSLEPRNSVAGHALRTIMGRVNPDRIETVLAVIRAQDAESLSAAWEKADAAWSRLTPEGAIESGATPVLRSLHTPAGLATSPARMTANAAKLTPVDFQKAIAAFDTALAASDFDPAQFAGARGLLNALAEAAAGRISVVEWSRNLPESSAWWFLIGTCLSRETPTGIAHLKPLANISTEADASALRSALAVPGVEIGLSGWGYTLSELGPWSERKMVQLSGLMVLLNVALLVFLLRTVKPVIILMIGLALASGALFATLKLAAISINLFNVLAFPLVLGVGVDYGIYIALALRSADPAKELRSLMKPVLLSGLTTVVGFGSLAWAQNPALRGLGLVCGIGVAWCLLATFLWVLPACSLVMRRKRGAP